MKLQRPISKAVVRAGGVPPARLHRVLDYINTHLHEKITLNRMAAEVEMSPFHFGRLFKQSTGFAPHQYILQERIAKSKLLLEDDRVSITEVGDRCGFASRSHFATVFRKFVGATPKEYRRQKAK